MKRTIMITMLAMLMAVPSMAQYGRRPYGRPVAPYHRDTRMGTTRHYSPIGGYVGLRIGLNVSSVYADDSQFDCSSPKTGFNVGLVTGIQMAPGTPLYLETGLLLTEKGGKSDGRNPLTYNMTYLEVPFLVKYQYNFDRLTSIQPFAGFFGALGVSGQIRDKERHLSRSSFSDDAFKRFDAGLRVGCGIQFDHFYAELGYDASLANISRDDYNMAHNGCFYTSIGVNF